jgi:SNF2 family DNA or RNA helicase
MMDVENNYDMSSSWICSDVGMGKSAVVIAAICANPMPVDDQPSAEQVKAGPFNKDGQELNLKCTVILTTKSLLGQWEDEIMKDAPHLNVFRVYGKSKLKLKDLADADIIVSTSTKE